MKFKLYQGHTSSVKYVSHFTEWALYQIKQWLVTPTCFCHHCHSIISGRTECQSKV